MTDATRDLPHLSFTALPDRSTQAEIRPRRSPHFVSEREAALFYKISPDHLRAAMHRHIRRFPDDLAFQVPRPGSTESGPGRPRKSTPNAFTPAGVWMLATVLPGTRAALDHIALIRRAESIRVMPARVERCRTFQLRGQTIMLDGDLAAAYLTTSGRLLTVFGANPNRFPPDFAFELSEHETNCLNVPISGVQSAYDHRLPWAFTAKGATMLASLLRGPDAIAATLAMVRSVAAAGTELPALEASFVERRDVTA